MKRLNVEATNENILHYIENDILHRTNDIVDFIQLLESIEDNAFIALDGAWGTGKTFFVRQIETTLNYHNKKVFGKGIEVQEQQAYTKNVVLGDKLQLNKTYLPIYFNSWLYDNHTNALMALLFVMIKQTNKIVDTHIDSEFSEKMASILDSIQFWKSSNWQNLRNSFYGTNFLEEACLLEEIQGKIKNLLNDIIVESAEKLVVFIDELDRCKPTFAVEILESVKHYFDDDRIIFVLSVNKEQLIHTITKHYGINFDSSSYLNKFFDINIQLPEVDTTAYFWNLDIACDDVHWLRKFANGLQKEYKLSLRDTTIYFQKINIIFKNHYGTRSDEWTVMQLLIPILLILQMKDIIKYKEVLEGKGFEIVKDIVQRNSDMMNYLSRWISTIGINEEREQNALLELEKIYTFVSNSDDKKRWYEGKFEISSTFKTQCIKICNESVELLKE